MQENPRNTDDFLLFRYEMFNFFWLLVFRHEERDTQFLLCWLFLHRPSVNSSAELAGPISTNWPNKRAVHPVAPSWTVLAQVQISTNCFFQKSPNFPAHCFRAWRHSHPSLISYLGLLLWHLWLSHPPCASVNTCTKSRIVQSLTKPNDEI